MAKRGESSAKMNMFNKGRENIVPAKKEETKVSEPQKEVVETPKAEEKSSPAPEKPAKQTPSRTQGRPANKNDALFKDSRKEHGVQRTTYYEKDVYDYVEEISKKYDINFNKVVNKILRDYMNAE